MTISICCGGEEKHIDTPHFLALKFDCFGGINIVGSCEGTALDEFELGGVHIALYETGENIRRIFSSVLDSYDGSLLFAVTVNNIEVTYRQDV